MCRREKEGNDFMFAVLIAIQASTFVFDGGSNAEFVSAVANHCRRGAMICVEEPLLGRVSVKWPTDFQGKSLTFEAGIKFQNEAAAAALGFTAFSVKAVSLRPAAMPWYRFPVLAKGRYGEIVFPTSPDLAKVQNGQVMTRQSDDRYFVPAHLSMIGLQKPVSVHRFLRMTPISFSDATYAEQDFIQLVATVIGAKVTESDSGIFLDVDIDVFRSQMIARFERDAATAKSKLSNAKAQFQAEAMRIAPVANLRTMVDRENYLDVFALPINSQAQKLALAYAQLYMKEALKGRNGDTLADPTIAELMRTQGNFDRALRVVLKTTGSIEAMVMYGKDAGGVGF